MSRTILLNCYVIGDKAHKIFYITIDTPCNVADLKDVIKDKLKPRFDNIPANELALWKISIADDESFEENVNKITFEDATALRSVKKMDGLFPNPPDPEHVHIVVRQPLPMPPVVPPAPVQQYTDLKVTNNPVIDVSDVTQTLEADINDIYYGSESQFSVPLIYLENVLESRYGFSDKVPSLVDWTEFDGQPLSDKEWLITYKAYAQLPLSNNLPSQYKLMVHYFTCRMLSSDFTSLSAPSHHIWDLRTMHTNSMQEKMRDSLFYIECVHIDGKTMYEVKLKTPVAHLGVSWRLVLEDPVTALQCIRENFGYGLKDVALGLAYIGASFHMFEFHSIPRNPVQGCMNSPMLRYRPQNYRPTVGDYAQYVELRNATLQGARGHAAITRGGILWRLAVESLQPSIIINEDIKIDFLQHGDTQYYTGTNGQYCETALTEADELTICGVYHVYTGKGEQTAHKSWWPKPSAWAMSGLNVGYWSAGCEHWYQERLRMIQEGKAELRNASEWTISLTFQRKTRPLIAHHKKAAEMFLEGQYIL